MSRSTLFSAAFAVLAVCAAGGGAIAASLGQNDSATAHGQMLLSDEELLGKQLFFDAGLSHPTGQSCASCHEPANAFIEPDQDQPTSAGANLALFGSRNAPTAGYAAFSPAFHFDSGNGVWVGGQFWDGRAGTLEHQAQLPFLGASEMGNINAAQVVDKVKNGPNADLFRQVYGPDAFDDVDTAYGNIANAIGAFERTPEVSPFTSRFDYYLQGKVNLTAKERRGLDIFNDPAKANCAACHPSTSLNAGETPPLFTDFTYDNVGIPKNYESGWFSNPNNPDGLAFINLGLGAVVDDPNLDGAFKASTLRNIELKAPYGHNGYFTSIEQIVDFYATRDVKPVCSDPATPAADALLLGCWPAAEIPHTMNLDELGDLPLTAQDKEDMVTFLMTLTDGYDVNTQVPAPASAGMLAAGLASFVWLRRRKRARIA